MCLCLWRKYQNTHFEKPYTSNHTYRTIFCLVTTYLSHILVFIKNIFYSICILYAKEPLRNPYHWHIMISSLDINKYKNGGKKILKNTLTPFTGKKEITFTNDLSFVRFKRRYVLFICVIPLIGNIFMVFRCWDQRPCDLSDLTPKGRNKHVFIFDLSHLFRINGRGYESACFNNDFFKFINLWGYPAYTLCFVATPAVFGWRSKYAD